MDHSHKTWLWRKKSTERMVVASDKVKLPATINEEEIQTLLTSKVELEKDLRSLNNKLSACLSECNAKDVTIKKHVKMAEEAMEGWEKAEAKAANLMQELDFVSRQRAAGEERSTNLEGALKECMRQLHFVREEQEQRIHDAVMKASTEFERSAQLLEEKLAGASQRNARLVTENTHLSKALLAKERSNEDLTRQRAQMETDLNALVSRLQSTEKENASLKYEVRVLEKELEIRNEEREFNRRAADVSHKQHLESVKKIAKLESECQRLCQLVRKRLPGPADVAKMRSEVDSAGRRRTEPGAYGFPTDSMKQVSFLTEQLCAAEEENKSLKEALDKKANELQVSRSMYARTASKLSQFELCLNELSKGQTSVELLKRGRSVFAPFEQSHGLVSDVGSDDKISCAESWASALISELEQFKHGKQRSSPSGKTVGASEISLMDDFAEMERLAVVSTDKQQESPPVSCDDATVSSGISNLETSSENSLVEKASDWLSSILKVVMEQAHSTQRKPHEILDDVRVALADTYPAESFSSKESGNQIELSDSAIAGEHVSLKPPDKYISKDSSCGLNDDEALLADSTRCNMQTDIGKSILKIIELVEGVTLPRYDGNLFPYMNAETSEYAVRVFQWKTSELGAVLQKFLQACYDLLNGKSDVSIFAQELTSALDWVMNHCFSIQDVSSMEDAIKKHLDLDETRSESEGEKDGFQHVTLDEFMKFNKELVDVKSAKNEIEERLQSALERSESLTSQLKKSEQTNAHLQAEVDNLKMSKALTENQMVKQIDAQFSVAKEELNEAHQKFSSMEMELENKNRRCDELEATCEKLQLQLESARKSTIPDQDEEKQLRTDREITAASEKLAECQETILNLGKQFKALATSTESTVAATTTNPTPVTPIKLGKQQSSLLDQMLAEDKAKTKDLGSKSPKMKQSENDRSVVVSNEAIEPLEKILLLYGSKTQGDKTRGTNLWRKLLWRTKKSRPPRPTSSHGHKD